MRKERTIDNMIRKQNETSTFIGVDPASCVDDDFVAILMPDDYISPKVDTAQLIMEVTEAMQYFLLDKNEKYGDSVFNPIKVFTDLPAYDLLLVRAQDKISRIINSDELRKNDCIDLCGYLLLIMINQGWMDTDDIKE